MVKYFIAAALVICSLASIRAQSVQVNAQFDTSQITLGDRVKLHVELEHQKDVRVQFPAWTDTLTRDIEIVEVYPVDSSRIDGEMMRYRQDILVTSFADGRHEVRPIRFPFTAGGYTDTIATRPIYLEVLTVPLDSTQNIADIKPVYAVPIRWADVWPWVWKIGILLLLIGGIGFFVYAVIRHRNNRPIFGTPKPKEPAHVTALRELDKLRGEKLWQGGRVKEYHTRVSDIIRLYLENRFGVAAMEMTSDEILDRLRNAGFENNDLVERLRRLFTLSDLVKFAKAEPLPDENETSVLDAYLFVNNTKLEVIDDSAASKNTTVSSDNIPEKVNENYNGA